MSIREVISDGHHVASLIVGQEDETNGKVEPPIVFEGGQVVSGHDAINTHEIPMWRVTPLGQTEEFRDALAVIRERLGIPPDEE